MKKTALVLLLFSMWNVIPAPAQKHGQPRIDSLLTRLPYSTNDTNKVNLLLGLTRAHKLAGQYDSAFAYASEAMKLSTGLGYKSGMAMAHNRLGNAYEGGAQKNLLTAKAHYEKAFQLWEELHDYGKMSLALSNIAYNTTIDSASTFRILRYAEQSKDSFYIGRALITVGRYYLQKNEPATAVRYAESALNYITPAAELETVVWWPAEVGSMCIAQFNYAKSLKYFTRTLELAQQIPDTGIVAQLTKNIGVVYFYMKQYSKALEKLELSRKLYEESRRFSDAANIMATMCEAYKLLPDDAKTLEFCFWTLHTFDKVGKTKKSSELAIVARSIAEVYRRQRRYVMAINYGKRAFDIASEIQDNSEISYAKKEVGLCLLALALDSNATARIQGDQIDSSANRTVFSSVVPHGKTEMLRLSQRYLAESLDFAAKNGVNDVTEDCYGGLVQVSAVLGDYKSAVGYYEKYMKLKDATFSADNNTSISLMEIKQVEEISKKQQEISGLEIEKATIQKRYFIGGLAALLLFTSLLYNRYRLKNKANILISREKERSENLLLNILPAEVAEELKNKGSADAKQFDDVTVLFTDFKSFTTVSEQLSPQELVNELHSCFKGFDEIITKYNIEKIKTIGDAYLAVCGLPLSDEKHSENVVNAALEIREFMEKRRQKFGKKTFEVRIGINSGSVVAGIVGVKKFAYDIWGDTVNTAARMEQHSEAGKINISETTYALVKDKFKCEYRGEIDAKNKGKLKMYFVEGKI